MNKTDIAKIGITDSIIWIELHDGRRAEERFADYARLANATDTQRRNYVVSHFGVHWPAIDEDLSFDGFFAKTDNCNESIKIKR